MQHSLKNNDEESARCARVLCVQREEVTVALKQPGCRPTGGSPLWASPAFRGGSLLSV